MVASW